MFKSKYFMENQVRLISYLQLRKAIGWLGIGLPIAMIYESLLYCKNEIRPSISDYYYSNLGDIFVGILVALAVFLFSYKGYEKEKDNLITNITAFAALGVAFFPTNGVENMCLKSCSSKISTEVYESLHLYSAGIFFLSLAILLIFYFTKTDNVNMTKQKILRNNIYRICGLIMLTCFLWIIISLKILNNKNIFWQESIALIVFGYAWLVKGELLFKDKD